jgi:hypothetical protein
MHIELVRSDLVMDFDGRSGTLQRLARENQVCGTVVIPRLFDAHNPHVPTVEHLL